jgi:hypothetical protein
MPVILGLSYVLWEKTPKEESYGVSVYAAVNQTLIFVAPVLSLGAVLEAQPLKRIWPGLTVRRTWAASLCQRLSSVLLTAAVTIVLLYGMATITAKSVSPDALWFPGLTLLSASSWILFGMACGLVLNGILSVAVGVLVPFMFIALPPGWSPLWVRHLTGVPVDCCSPGDVINLRVVGGSAAILVLIATLSLILANLRLSPSGSRIYPKILLALLVIPTLLAPSVWLVSALGAFPTTPRDPRDLVCQHQVCVWPEERSSLAVNIAAWDAVRTAWISSGLPLRTTKISSAPGPGSLELATHGMPEEAAELSMLSQLPRSLANCPDTYDSDRRNQIFNQVSALIAHRMGLQSQLPSSSELETGHSAGNDVTANNDVTSLWKEVRSCDA